MTANELIEKVREIDQAAADYLRNEAPKLDRYAGGGEDNISLDSIMAWPETPQGLAYWDDINEKLEGKE